MSQLLILVVLPFVTIMIVTLSLAPFVSAWIGGRAAAFQQSLDEKNWDKIDGRKLALQSVISALALGIVCHLLFRSRFVTLLMLVLGYNVPWWYVLYQMYRRHRLLEEQLETGLGSLANSMRSGLTLIMAVKAGSQNLPEPISEEFGIIAKEYELGKSLDETLSHSRRRFNSINWNLAVVAILVSRAQGGNLSETLERISAFMRDVFAIDRKIQVLTAEGRLGAKIIGLSPLVMGFMLWLGSPEQIEPLFNDPVGGVILFFIVAINLAGFFWIQKIVAIEV